MFTRITCLSPFESRKNLKTHTQALGNSASTEVKTRVMCRKFVVYTVGIPIAAGELATNTSFHIRLGSELNNSTLGGSINNQNSLAVIFAYIISWQTRMIPTEQHVKLYG